MTKTSSRSTAKLSPKSVSKPSETVLKRDVQNMRAELADRLLTLRAKHDLSQARLAELAGVDRKTINRIENGHFSPALRRTKVREALLERVQAAIHRCRRLGPETR